MSQSEIKAEVAGSMWKVLIKPGDTFDEGDTLMIIESMKMEIPVIAEDAGRVLDVRATEGQPVAEGEIVCTVELS